MFLIDDKADNIFLVPDLLPKDGPKLDFNGIPAFAYVIRAATIGRGIQGRVVTLTSPKSANKILLADLADAQPEAWAGRGRVVAA